MSDEIQFPVIYAVYDSFFQLGGYFNYNEPPLGVKNYMALLNKDIKARNDVKIAAAQEEGRPKPKVGKGPKFGPDELEPENTTCVIQVSQGLNAGGIKVPGISFQRPNPLIQGGNGYYMQNVAELISFLTMNYGETPNLKAFRNYDTVIMGRKGILTFGKMHTEFYNGNSIVQSGDINQENNRNTARMDPGSLWGQGDIRFWEIRPPDEQHKKSAQPGSFLNGWWTVYDGNYYFYYFAPPYVAYTKTKPHNPTDGAPWSPANRGTVKPGDNNTYIVTWNAVAGGGTPTIETFWRIGGDDRKMNARSNKYSMIYAVKITPDIKADKQIAPDKTE